MALAETLFAILVLTLVAASSGGLFAALTRQSELNRQTAAVNTEAGSALAAIQASPFDGIKYELLSEGFKEIRPFTYRKDLSGPPAELENGEIEVSFRGATCHPLPNPLYIDLAIRWDVLGTRTSRSFITVRTK